MMQAIKQSRFPKPTYPWYLVGTTISRASVWHFDRWRLYTPAPETEVAIFFVPNTSTNPLDSNGEFTIEPNVIKPFNSVQNFEHDFAFDLSGFAADGGTTNVVYIGMRTPPENSKFQQIYTYPTGFGATRGKNAQIKTWDFSRFGVGDGIGLDIGRLRFENQPIADLDWKTTATPKILAKEIRFTNSQLSTAGVDKLLIWTNAAGLSSGTMFYSGIPGTPTVASRAAYDALIARGWAITGTPPPTT